MTTIWTTYHKAEQIEQYGLRETDTRKLFGAHLDDMGRGINRLNPVLSELVTLYFVWRNQLKSDLVGFNHYRRQFEPMADLQPGECQIYSVEHLGDMTIRSHYALCHNQDDFDAMLDALDAHDGTGNVYTMHLIHDRQFINRCCFLMHWRDFERLCEWLFPILEDIQQRCIGIGFDSPAEDILKAWRDHAVIHPKQPDQSKDYQMRTLSFLGERLIGVWIANNLIVANAEDVGFEPW